MVLTPQSIYCADDREWTPEWPRAELAKEQVVAGEQRILNVFNEKPLISKNTELVIKEHTLENYKENVLLKLL